MQRELATPSDMINDLLLNQCFTKIDISKIIRASTQKIDSLLCSNDLNKTEFLTDYQLHLLAKLYHRMKSFENQIDDFLVGIYKVNFHSNNFSSSKFEETNRHPG
jgi:hypothetical protein